MCGRPFCSIFAANKILSASPQRQERVVVADEFNDEGGYVADEVV